jgi:hypothetical protein
MFPVNRTKPFSVPARLRHGADVEVPNHSRTNSSNSPRGISAGFVFAVGIGQDIPGSHELLRPGERRSSARSAIALSRHGRRNDEALPVGIVAFPWADFWLPGMSLGLDWPEAGLAESSTS